MKRFLALVLSLGAAACFAQDVAITNTRIIVGNGTVVPSGTIIVRGGKIVSASAGKADTKGLKIIDGEIHRISSDLASGSFDALATQNRYLQLKYDAGLGGS